MVFLFFVLFKFGELCCFLLFKRQTFFPAKTQLYINASDTGSNKTPRADVEPEEVLISLVLLSEFGEGSILFFKSFNLNLQLSESLPQKSGLDIRTWVGKKKKIFSENSLILHSIRITDQWGKLKKLSRMHVCRCLFCHEIKTAVNLTCLFLWLFRFRSRRKRGWCILGLGLE